MACELLVKGRSSIRILTVFRREQERLRSPAGEGGTDPFQFQIELTARRLGLSHRDVADVVERWMFIKPGRWLRVFRRRGFLATVAGFQAAGGKAALVSDYPARHKLAALKATELFEIVVACGEPGGPPCLKPQPRGLLMAAERLGVAAADCLVIGDRLDADGEAARRAGMAFQHIHGRWPHY
jgi:beta-phosphoglucomutase-like phosphatase (HAD superfamily)